MKNKLIKEVVNMDAVHVQGVIKMYQDWIFNCKNF